VSCGFPGKDIMIGTEIVSLDQEVHMTVFKKFVSVLLVVVLMAAFSGQVTGIEKQPAASKRININTATVQELTGLPGIGEKIALRIVNFRKKNGKFKRIEELMKVKGIGEKLFVKLKNRITV
jgi:comEA protein